MEKDSILYVIIKKEGEWSSIIPRAFATKTDVRIAVREYQKEHSEQADKVSFKIQPLRFDGGKYCEYKIQNEKDNL